MSAPTIPSQRQPLVPCETCGTPLPGLLSTCKRKGCLAADIDAIAAADLQEYDDDE